MKIKIVSILLVLLLASAAGVAEAHTKKTRGNKKAKPAASCHVSSPTEDASATLPHSVTAARKPVKQEKHEGRVCVDSDPKPGTNQIGCHCEVPCEEDKENPRDRSSDCKRHCTPKDCKCKPKDCP